MSLRTFDEIDLRLVDANPWQPRTSMDGIEELAEDIKLNGLYYAPSVRVAGERYQLRMGHRRFEALKLLGFTRYALEIVTATDHQMAITALSENTRRRDLKPMEEYRAWQKALEIDGMGVQELAAAMGLDRSTVSNNLRLLRLPQFVLQHVDTGEMSAHAAREFLGLMGSDGHFHETEAKEALGVLTSGTPDWRVGRVRFTIAYHVGRHPVADWRRLYKDGQYDTSAPVFDVDAFKAEHAAKVHTIPRDEWTSYSPTTQGSKLRKEGSGEWTCATAAWAKAQSAGKKAAEGVAGAAAKKTESDGSAAPKTPGKTSKWPAVLSQDPVFKNVSPETDGPLIKTLTRDERNEQAAAQMGTRGTPGLVPKKGKGFVAPVDERHELYGWYDYNLRERPGYFADIIECRTKCTTGAAYLQKDDKSPFELFCTNESCFDQHCTKGRQVVEQKVAKAVRDIDARDDELYEVLYEHLVAGPAEAVPLLAAVVIQGINPKKVSPETRDYEVDRELAVWTANAQHLAVAAGVEDADGLREGFDINDGNARELLLRAVVERSRSKEGQAFVEHFLKAATEPALPVTAEDGLTQE